MQVEWDQIVTYYLLYSLAGLAILLTLLHMLYKRRSPLSMTAWLLLMVIAPYAFVLFYFFFGIRKRSLHKEKSSMLLRRKDDKHLPVHPIDTLLRNNGLPSSTHDNSFHIYTDGVKAYEALYAALDAAEHSICISTYLLKNDVVTQRLFDLLIQKSKAGVKVRILTDAFGSIGMFFWQTPLKKMRAAGIEISFFMSLFTFPLHNRFNLRYHRKIYLIDNRVLLSGGMNLASEYMGPEPVNERWSDLLFKGEGPMVHDYCNIFESDWAFSHHTRVKKAGAVTPVKKGECVVQVIPSGADVAGDPLLEGILYGIHNASKRVWIVTPYFIPDESILQALGIALHRGVDVKLITPKESDNLIADLGRSSYIRESQELGINVALYKGPMLHAKAILFDDDALILGSVNLDVRSLLLNYEVVSVIYTKETINEAVKWMKKLMKDADADIEPADRVRRILENLMRIFVPQL